MKLLIIIVSIMSLLSCGDNSRRVHQKQRTASDIQISSLDLGLNKIELRFEYRTYVEKTLEKIDCNLTFKQAIKLELHKETKLALDAFSTEILTFDLENFSSFSLNQSKEIVYNIQCKATYNKGSEFIDKDSALHLVPSSLNKYR